MHMGRSIRRLAASAVLVSGLGLGAAAQAAPVTYSFSGVVNAVSAGLAPPFAAGNTLTGTYTVESTTAALGGSTAVSAVFNALTALSFTVGGYSASSAGAPEVQIGNRDGISELTDRYAVVSRASDGLTGVAVNTLALQAFILRMDQNAGTLFGPANGPLPTAVSLGNFDSSSFFLFFDGFATVSGTLTALQPVPEPSGLAILGLALIAFALAARRQAA